MMRKERLKPRNTAEGGCYAAFLMLIVLVVYVFSPYLTKHIYARDFASSVLVGGALFLAVLIRVALPIAKDRGKHHDLTRPQSLVVGVTTGLILTLVLGALYFTARYILMYLSVSIPKCLTQPLAIACVIVIVWKGRKLAASIRAFLLQHWFDTSPAEIDEGEVIG